MNEPRSDWHPIVMELAIGLVTKNEAGAFVFNEGGIEAIEATLDQIVDPREYIFAVADLGSFSGWLKSQGSGPAGDEIAGMLSRSVQRREVSRRDDAHEQAAQMSADSSRLADVTGGVKERREDLLKPVPADAVRSNAFHIPRKV